MPDRILQGVATIWTDNHLLPGPKGTPITITLAIDPNGQVNANLHQINLEHNVIIRQNGNGIGHYVSASGTLDLNVPISVDNVPTGRVDDLTIHLSTAAAVSPPHAGSVTGVPVTGSPNDATGSITLVGTTQVKVSLDTPLGPIPIANNVVWIRVLGTLLG